MIKTDYITVAIVEPGEDDPTVVTLSIEAGIGPVIKWRIIKEHYLKNFVLCQPHEGFYRLTISVLSMYLALQLFAQGDKGGYEVLSKGSLEVLPEEPLLHLVCVHIARTIYMAHPNAEVQHIWQYLPWVDVIKRENWPVSR